MLLSLLDSASKLADSPGEYRSDGFYCACSLNWNSRNGGSYAIANTISFALNILNNAAICKSVRERK